MSFSKLFLFLLIIFYSGFISADDGYRLWLKYDKIKEKSYLDQYSFAFKSIVTTGKTDIFNSAATELQNGLQGLLAKKVTIGTKNLNLPGQIILSINVNEGVINHEDGYHIYKKGSSWYIEAKKDQGILYGVFEFLRRIQTRQPLAKWSADAHNPRLDLRLLNHWDNPNGTIERGYAGSSLWKWYDLPEVLDPRYTDYARANASIGINGTVVNNVNASARFLSAEYLHKVAGLASVFRNYGIKTYLSIRFTAPIYLSGFKTADPLDPAVRLWWKNKVDEVYKIIPDFGGFVVKANSEGEPGPQDYNRNHADGANMLAEALAPHKGIVMWRAFVYKANPSSDRAAESYSEFEPLDGKFLPNVIVQVKNGPIDFQPREPFHPLFGAMPLTSLMMEFQITQEYLGMASQWVYLGTLFEEGLKADTYTRGNGTSVAKVLDGSIDEGHLKAIAGVANTGSDRNWCGHIGNQSNWYAYGRLAWDHSLSAATIADEWIRMSLTNDASAVPVIKTIMMNSRETAVNYMTPLGLHHIMGQGIHFGPEPWLEKSGRPDWTSIYYHKADSFGVGFNRTLSGSKAINVYHPAAQAVWSDPKTCPLAYLLWFHHIGWNEKLSTGKTLWEELCFRYYSGVAEAGKWKNDWKNIASSIDPEIYKDIAGKLEVQHKEAIWWRDACLLYFGAIAKMKIPAEYPAPKRSLEEIKKLVELYQMR